MIEVDELDTSFPTRERGLKCKFPVTQYQADAVVPHAGTWIEITEEKTTTNTGTGRSPRGNVD